MPGELLPTALREDPYSMTDRTLALEALAAGATAGGEVPAPVARTGEEVYAGGDEARLLIQPAHIVYLDRSVDPPVLAYPAAGVGDVVLLTKAEAKRLDELGVTVEPSADLEEVAEELAGGLATDAQLAAMNATDLVAYVVQNPDERERVRALEEERGDKARKTVLSATEPTPEAELEAAAQAAAQQQTPPTEGAGTGSSDDDPDVILE
jgi:hypothetical protein